MSEIKGWVLGKRYDWMSESDATCYVFAQEEKYPQNHVDNGFVVIQQASVHFDELDAQEFNRKQIDSLKKEMVTVRAQMQARITEIQEQIQSLLAIEHKQP